MKTVLIILLSLCLALSLWLKHSGERAPLRQSDSSDPAIPILVDGQALVPPDASKIDFSDTGLSDSAWKLESNPDVRPLRSNTLSTDSGVNPGSEFEVGIPPSILSIPSIGTIPTDTLNEAPATSERLNSIITN